MDSRGGAVEGLDLGGLWCLGTRFASGFARSVSQIGGRKLGGSDTMKSTVKFAGRPHTIWEPNMVV